MPAPAGNRDGQPVSGKVTDQPGLHCGPISLAKNAAAGRKIAAASLGVSAFGRDAEMVFVVDDLAGWLIGTLASSGAKRLAKLVLGDEQERALHSAVAAALKLTAEDLARDGGQADELAAVISEVLRSPMPNSPLAVHGTFLEALHVGIALQLAVLDDADLTGAGRSSAEVLGVSAREIARRLAGHLVDEIISSGARGGPLAPLADRLSHEKTQIELQQIERQIERSLQELSGMSPPSPDEMLATGDLRAQDQIADRRNAETARELFIRSDALRAGQQIAAYDWRGECRQRVQQLITFCRGEPELSEIADQLASVNWRGGFETVHRALTTLPLTVADKELAAMVARSPGGPPGERRRRAVGDAQRLLRWLLGQAASPRFRCCLPVAGSWGSGKSRLLTEIAQALRQQGHLVIFLRPTFAGSLRNGLLEQAGATLGWRENDLDSLVRRLRNELGRQLVVLFDDFTDSAAHRPEVLDAMIDLIKECTVADAIRWVIAADYLHLDSLLLSRDPTFWLRYGYHPDLGRQQAIDGWLFLDDINTSEQVGLKLLQAKSGERDRADLAQIRLDAASFDFEARSLCNPLPAWLRLEVANEDLDTGLLNLYLPRFVSAYWKQRSLALSRDRNQAERLDALVTLLARRFAPKPGSPVTLPEVQESLSQFPRLAPAVMEDIDVLTSGGILDRPRPPDANQYLEPEEYSPKLAILWGYRIAAELTQALDQSASADQVFAALRPWGRLARSGDWVAEAVTEFGLALLPWQGAQAKVTRSVWRRWYSTPALPPHPLFLAGVSVPDAGQALLRDLLKSSPSVNGKRDLFLLLRLIAMASTSRWQAQDRLGAVQHHYQLVGSSGLGPYLAYVVDMILARDDITTSQNYASALACLAFSEKAGVAATIADAAIAAGWRIFGDDAFALLTNVVRFLRLSGLPGHAHGFPLRPDPGSTAPTMHTVTDPNSTPAYFFWQHLIRAATRTAAEHRGIDAFSDLARVDWLSGAAHGIERHVAFRMRQEANVALGAVFRGSHHDGDGLVRQQFVALVGSLANGHALDLPRAEQQEIAFYLIRHTSVTGGRPAVLVDRSLWPVLRTLCHDPRLRARLNTAMPTCALNGCEQCAAEMTRGTGADRQAGTLTSPGVADKCSACRLVAPAPAAPGRGGAVIESATGNNLR